MRRLKETGILIPTYNALSCKTFFELIKLLSASQSDLGKILIIDSSSNDRTVEFVTNLGIEVLEIPTDEFDHGATRDMGCKILSEKHSLKYVVFLTQDVLLDSQDSLYHIIRPFDDDLVGAVCGRQVPHDNANFLAKHSRLFNYKQISRFNTQDNIADLGLQTAFMSNSFASYNLQILNHINGFPEKIILGEDMCVAAKMILNGYKTYYCSEAIVKHSHNYSLFEEFKRYFDIGVSHFASVDLLAEFKSPNKEGIKYLISELKYTIKMRSLFWFCNSLIRSCIKFIGYNLGKNHLKINVRIKKFISMHKYYWD